MGKIFQSIMRAQFIRGKEPKQSMDIGFKTWGNIKPKDILIPQKEVHVSTKGSFDSSGSADTIWPDMVILVLLVQKFYDPELAKHIIYLNYFKCWDLPEALRRRNEDNDLLPARRMFGTRQQMENRFNILQRKDES
jgi:hypothetical protein